MASNDVLARLAIYISANTAELGKSLSSASGQLKSFQSGLKSIGTALIGTFGAVQIFNGLKAGVALMSEFESTMSEVKAITGATGSEFKALQADALRLGAATKFTATEVGKLQVAYGRLGFNTKEIIAATEATLDLAAATGEDLAKSADVAGSTVRGFGLEAKETQRVVDVMAKSFNTTALGLDNFTEAMKYVAPVAAAANLSLEETTALLGTLADAGLRGSMAGTALRKILTDLPRDGRPFQERLEELSKKGITLSDSMDEVGRTAQTALLVLTKNNDKTKELAASFQNVAGEAARMARTMSDNLAGDVTKLSSAWEGLIISFSNLEPLRNATQALTSFLSALSGGAPDAIDGLKLLAQGIRDGVDESNKGFQIIVNRLKDIRRETGKPLDPGIASELAEKYQLTEEQGNKLYATILDINKSLSFQEQVLATFGDFAKGYKDVATAAELYKEGLFKLILAEQINLDQLKKTAAMSGDAGKALAPQISASQKLIDSYYKRIKIINEYVDSQGKAETKVQESIQKTVINLKFYQDSLKGVNDAFESLALAQDASGKFTEKTASGLRVLAAEGAGLDGFIKRVNAFKDSFKNIDVVLKAPDTTAIQTFFDQATGALKQFKNEFGTLTHSSTIMDEVTLRFENGLERMANAAKNQGKVIKSSFIDLTGVIHGALSGIGQALGNAIGGGESFGKALLGVLGGVMVQLGEMLITAGLGVEAFKASLKSLNGVVAIVAGVALVALGTAVGASIKKLGSSAPAAASVSSVSSSASTDSRSLSARDAQDVKVTGNVVIRGQDMYVIFKNYENGNQFTRANG
jgi:hypothetical protein